MLRNVVRASLILSAALLASAFALRLAQAHGSMLTPISRVYACYLENPETPDTLACRDAIVNGGTQALYDWNEVNIRDAAGQHRALIPDGQLCSAGREKYAAFDEPRPDWARTVLPASGEYTFQYAAYVPHNMGYFELYVTRDGYDPLQPLKWSDLEDSPFLRVDHPPVVDGNYVLTGPLPPGKSGHHLIYTIWQRNDSPEAFYACSDVWFGTAPTPTPPALEPCTAPAWNSASVYAAGQEVNHENRQWQARWGNSGSAPSSEGATNAWMLQDFCQSGAVTPTSVTPTTPAPTTETPTPPTPLTATPTSPTTPAPASCQVSYALNPWGNGFTANVKVTNHASTPIEGWTLTWSYAHGQQITSAWNATVTQNGVNVTAGNPAAHWNGTIPAGGSVSFGVQGTSDSTNGGVPTDFALNGATCNNGTPSTPYTPPPTTTATATASSVTPATPTATPSTPAAAACQVVYAPNAWSSGFTADVQITNNGSAPIQGWTLAWRYANGQQITSAWNATVTQSGANVTASNVASHWNGTIPAGGAVSFGVQGTSNGTNNAPLEFTLNGAACSTP
ncbi:MAG: cellulose binding domain-containing protein [Chloroflexota bacterium]